MCRMRDGDLMDITIFSLSLSPLLWKIELELLSRPQNRLMHILIPNACRAIIQVIPSATITRFILLQFEGCLGPW